MKTAYSAAVRLAAAAFLLFFSFSSNAYDSYSTGVSDQGNCATCHGAFRDGDYVSHAEGITWSGTLHEAHLGNTNVTSSPGSCDSCHGGVGTSGRQVKLNSSGKARDGANGNAIACMGCHGRLEDANDLGFLGEEGWGAGLRQHHENSSHALAGSGTCSGCHPDANPASFTPAPENTMPPWYASITNTSIGMAMNPCSVDGEEDFSSNGTGTDNDGDHVYDVLDSDCAPPVAISGDFNADGMSDILWRNSTSGQNWAYLMNGAQIDQSLGINTVAADWEIVGKGDYDGDGDADILWRNGSTGQNWLYLMDSAAIDSSVGVNTVSDTLWDVVANGDYNGDGKSDILWRNSATGQNWLYLMNGATITSSLGVNAVSDSNWIVAGSGDYNGDGKADILWRNISTGQNWMYLMDGATITSSIDVNTVADTNWVIAGGDDHNGDGKSDILWRNSSTGQNWMYLMDGATITSSVGVNTVSDLNWQIVGSGDCNGDGKSDILWRNGSTGQNWLYMMNGATITSSVGVNTVSDTAWQIVNTR